jgi:CDP-diacylglycerol pyrophosphatase
MTAEINQRRFPEMFFLQTKTYFQWTERGFARQLLVVAFALTSTYFFPTATPGAQIRAAAETQVESGYVAEACPRVSNPNALKALARKCSKSLTSDANCRAYTNFKRDSEAVESYIILKDCAESKPFGYLIIPTETLVGVESSKIFSTSIVDLWGDAWLWSKRFPGLPSSQIGLAINSNLPGARSQNQFHIHISCASSEASKTLEERREISYDQSQAVLLPLGTQKHRYYAVKVVSLIGPNSPFNVAKTVLKSTANNLSGHGIAVIGSRNPGEYYVLVSSSEPDNPGDAEELLDEDCKNQN